ncbi:hypothetical protein GGQ74_000178 [Desulfobaculum xiamenense]|uniref:Spore protein YkvP/CgeB glycosyl transferase-like domain-containing protein n=1 Tax=Desulfobaculum xiamenense TaxID=995050 RepID=A0A846QDT4_9BACT|nr:glycosyltransferase [Desulfobaculum xiamenense]NJB66538.1 hypothetical protein [Desulfobaculum xiamenense]
MDHADTASPRTIAWIGNPFFAQALVAQGFRIVHIPLPTNRMLGFDDIAAACGGTPYATVLGDVSTTPLLRDVESWPCLTAFHCVDAHIHSWHPLYAQSFDLCSVALRGEIERFRHSVLPDERILWLPNFAFDDIRPAPARAAWDLLFVGTVDRKTTPRRKAFLDALALRLPNLVVMQGDFRALFPKARLVLNYCERGDLNFRVFEALACGSCLITPRVGHGLSDLFADGEDLFIYDTDNMDGLVALVRSCLSDPQRCARVAESGRRKVDAAHRETHRAAQFAQWLNGFDAHALVAQRLERRAEIRSALRFMYLLLAEDTPGERLKKEYLDMALPLGG